MKVTAKKKLFKGGLPLKPQSLLVRPFAKNGEQRLSLRAQTLLRRPFAKNGEQGLSLQNQPLLSQPFATTGANRARNPVTTGVTKRAAVVMVGFAVATFASIYFLHPFAPDLTHADTLTTTIDSTTYYINIASAGSLSTSIEAGQMGAFGSMTDTLTVNSNTPNGFRMYISADGADNSLSSASTSASIPSIAGSTMQPVSLSDNTWGWATTKSATNNFDNADYSQADETYHYAGMPASGSEYSLTAASGSVTDLQIPIYYGVYVNNATPSGTYVGTVKYTAVAEATADGSTKATATTIPSLDGGTVTFTTSLMSGLDPGEATVTINNGSSEVTCTNPTTAISPSTDTVTVTCTAPAMTYPGEYQATIHLIKYNKTYTATVKYAPQLGFTDQDGHIITTLQDMTPSFCANVTTPPDPLDNNTNWGDIVYGTLIDSRDQNEYLVGKLADGNCWMLQNLRLDLDSSTPLTPEKTNITTNWTPSTSIQKDSTRVQWTPDCDGDGSTTADDIPCAADTPRSYKVGSGILGDTQTTNTNYGNYYSWSAATAGTRNTDVGAGEATGDICPKGWRLPTNSGDKSWHNLLFTAYGLTDYNAASNTKALAAPFYLLYSGYYNWSDPRVYGQGSYGHWWSSTAYSASYARSLNMYPTSRLIPQRNDYRTFSFSVRCVAQ